MNQLQEDTLEEVQVTIPKMYKVILHNDAKTTYDFVIMLLHTVFHKSFEESFRLTVAVDKTGSGIAGIYDKETAEMKTSESIQLANEHGFPLNVTFEEE